MKLRAATIISKLSGSLFTLALFLAGSRVYAQSAPNIPAILQDRNPPKDQIVQWMSGTIGREPVVLYVVLRNHNQPVDGHYSYARYGKEIPLKGNITGDQIELMEPGTGKFILHLNSTANGAIETSNFQNSTGLTGTWANGTKTLPVRLHFEGHLGNDHDSDYYPDGYPHAQEGSNPNFHKLNGCVRLAVSR